MATIDNTEESFLIGLRAEEPLPFIWVGTTLPAFWTAAHRTSAAPIHVAFAAKDRTAVDRFYAAALDAGGIDNGDEVLRRFRPRPGRQQRRGGRARVAAGATDPTRMQTCLSEMPPLPIARATLPPGRAQFAAVYSWRPAAEQRGEGRCRMGDDIMTIELRIREKTQ